MRIRKLLRPALLALVGTALGSQAHAANTYNPGDLFLGVRATGGQGATQDYLVNIGPASNYNSAGSAITVPGLSNVGAELSALFGANWHTRADVFWSISGGNLPGDTTSTLYATRARLAVGVPVSPWPGRSSSAQGVTSSKFNSLAGAYITGATVAVGGGLTQNTGDINSYASFQPGGTVANSGGISFAAFNPSIEGTFASGAANSELELFRILPVFGQNGTSAGVFKLDSAGALTFTPAVASSNASVYLDTNQYNVSEADPSGKVTVKVVRSAGLANAFTVNLSTNNATAIGGTDFTAQSNVSVSFAANDPHKFVDIPIANRAGFQGNRSFTVALSSPSSGATIVSPSTSTVTIQEADALVRFSAATYSVNEGTATVPVVINRIGNTAIASTVNFSTVSGTAIAGTDFTSQTNVPVPFAATETSKTVNVAVASIAGFQGDRSFTVTLSGASVGTSIGTPSTSTVTIVESSAAPLGFAATTYSKVPLDTLGQPNVFTVAVSRANGVGSASANVEVDATLPALAGFTTLTSPAHFTFSPPSVSFAAGETSKNVTVTLLSTTPTPGRFRLKLTGAAPGVASGADTTVVTVTKKDTAKPVLVITTPAATVPVPGTFALNGTVKDDNASDLSLFSVTLNGAPLTVTRDPYAPTAAKNFSATGLQAANGVNTIVVTARDAQGNLTVLTKSFTFTNTALGAALAGIYNGVLVPTGTSDNDKSGFVTITVTPASAAFTGKVTLGGITVPIKGLLTNAGGAVFLPTAQSSFSLIDKVEFDSFLGSLSFSITGTQATGLLRTSATGGTTLASFTADKTVTTAPVALLNLPTKGVYNVALPSEEQAVPLAHTLYPQGDGVGTLTLLGNGTATLKGYLADGTAFAAAGRLAVDNASVALHSVLYKKQGSLAGKLSFDLLASDTDVSGANLLWIRPAQPRARYYKAGWPTGLTVDAAGTKYNGTASINFGQGGDNLATGNATLVFEDGALTSAVSKGVNVNETTGAVKLIPATALDYKLSLSAGTGLFSGVFTHSDSTKPAFKGAILNKGANKAGFGYFLSTPPDTYAGSGQGGGVSLQP